MTTQQTQYYGFGLAERPILSGRRIANNMGHAQRWMATAEAAFAEPYKGVTTDGKVVPGLFPLARTGVSTQPVVDAALPSSRRSHPSSATRSASTSTPSSGRSGSTSARSCSATASCSKT